MRLLVTRPDPQGEQTAAAFRACGHEVTIAPLLRIETLQTDFGSGPWTAVVVTSANAIRAMVTHRRHAEVSALPMFVVGQRTAQVARDAGFANGVSADGDAGDLAALIARNLPAGSSLLYLAGEDRATDLAAVLTPAGISVQTAVIYRAIAQEALSDDALERLTAGTIDGVLHFSRRSAAAFVSAARASARWSNSLKCHHFCLSMQVAEPLVQAGAKHIHVAATPDEAAVLDLVGQG